MAEDTTGTMVYCDDGDGDPFYIREDMDRFRPWFYTAKKEGIPSIEVHLKSTDKPFELVTDHIVAFAPAANQKQETPSE